MGVEKVRAVREWWRGGKSFRVVGGHGRKGGKEGGRAEKGGYRREIGGDLGVDAGKRGLNVVSLGYVCTGQLLDEDGKI